MGLTCWKIKEKQTHKRRRYSIYNKKYVRIKEKILNKQKKIKHFSTKPIKPIKPIKPTKKK